MPRILLTDLQGTEHEITAQAGGKLMEVLREYEFGVAAICGGLCSCATCHVYVDPTWIHQLPPPQSDERDLLLGLMTYNEGSSRLSCQIDFTDKLDGIKVTVAPDE